VLFVNPAGKRTSHPAYLRGLGFVVREAFDWPEQDDAARDFHVVIVSVAWIHDAPMIAARLRAKPHFGRRLLIALVDRDAPGPARRSAADSGFDDVLDSCCDSRHLVARILRRLRGRAELRCVLPPPLSRRPAA
jgi:DNA-binding response OmpR family regulator